MGGATILRVEEDLRSSGPATSTSHTGLDEAGRDRVQTFMLVASVFALLMTVTVTVTALVGPWPDLWAMPVALGGATLITAGSWALARSPQVSTGTLHRILLLSIVVLSFVIGAGHVGHELKRYGTVTAFTPVTVLLVSFPFFVPASPRKTILVGIAGSSMLPIAIALVSAAGMGDVPPFDQLEIVFTALMASVGGWFVARKMQSLREELAQARKLGAYVLEEQIGHGGMGEVWRAQHGLLKRQAAIKLINPDLLDEKRRDDMMHRFTREAMATASLDSPHTVRLYDFGRSPDGRLFYVMELLDGIDLDTLVVRHGPQPPERVAALLLQVCDSLREAHGSGLVHRDIKPANIMSCRVGPTGEFAKVLDFGIVALLPEQLPEDSERLTHEGGVIGTPSYMAPEVLMGQPATARSDLYSLGCVAYWLLTGTPVFRGANAMMVGAAHMTRAAAPMEDRGASVPDALESIVQSCLAKRPQDRPASASALAASIRETGLATAWTAERVREWWDEPPEAPEPVDERSPPSALLTTSPLTGADRPPTAVGDTGAE